MTSSESTMEFSVKLANGDEIRKLSSFNSIKELYERINQAFGVPTSDILYCTLNTHNFRDMNSILGNYLSFGDFIVVHLCGPARELTIKKTQEFLGLTITDNANGRAFVKCVKSDNKQVEASIKPGDHIAAINSESTVGLRHYEVAKAIRRLPLYENFTIRLIQPKYVDKYLRPDAGRENVTLLNTCSDKSLTPGQLELSGAVSLSSTCDDLINSSLPIDKLLAKSGGYGCGGQNRMLDGVAWEDNSTNGVQVDSSGYKSTIDKINTYLESFLGINDNLLAIKIYRLVRENRNSFSSFSEAIKQSELEVFNFDEEMKGYLWKCATDLTVQ